MPVLDHRTKTTVIENIRAVVEMEERLARQRTLGERMGDVIGSFAGTVTFVVLHLVLFAGWAAINSGLVSFIPKFDPYPFSLLCMLVSMEGVLLACFVLIKQNRAGKHADRRAHLDLQVNLLAEKEITKVIQMLERIAAHLNIERGVVDGEAHELGGVTALGDLARELDEKLAEKA